MGSHLEAWGCANVNAFTPRLRDSETGAVYALESGERSLFQTHGRMRTWRHVHVRKRTHTRLLAYACTRARSLAQTHVSRV